MATVGEGLDNGVRKAFTRPIPKTAPAQMRYLIKQLKSTRAAAAALGIYQRTVERYVRGQIKKPRPALADRIKGEVIRRWQPQIRAKAKKTAATTTGLVIDTRARGGVHRRRAHRLRSVRGGSCSREQWCRGGGSHRSRRRRRRSRLP